MTAISRMGSFPPMNRPDGAAEYTGESAIRERGNPGGLGGRPGKRLAFDWQTGRGVARIMTSPQDLRHRCESIGVRGALFLRTADVESSSFCRPVFSGTPVVAST